MLSLLRLTLYTLQTTNYSEKRSNKTYSQERNRPQKSKKLATSISFKLRLQNSRKVNRNQNPNYCLKTHQRRPDQARFPPLFWWRSAGSFPEQRLVIESKTRQVLFKVGLLVKIYVKNIPGLILLLDFEKAFDTLEWPFIEKKPHNYDIESCIKGRSAIVLKLKEVCRQGCPLSPYLFVLSVEVQANAI